MILNESTVVRIADSVMLRKVGDEMVLLSLDSGYYFGLDPVGARIAETFEQGGAIGSAIDLVHGEFDTERDLVTQDALELVAQLLSHGLVVIT